MSSIINVSRGIARCAVVFFFQKRGEVERRGSKEHVKRGRKEMGREGGSEAGKEQESKREARACFSNIIIRTL